MLVAKTKDNLKACKCLDCPSYTLGCKILNTPGNLVKLMEDLDEVNHYEKMFCAFEKSKCIHEDRGCLCDTCPVHSKYNLSREDYCLKTGGELSRQCVAGFDDEQSTFSSSH
mgnify:CR=1 FL=1